MPLLDEYSASGVRSIMALGGDRPWVGRGDFTYAADLVAFIRKQLPHLSVGVAGYPEGHPATPNRLAEISSSPSSAWTTASFLTSVNAAA